MYSIKSQKNQRVFIFLSILVGLLHLGIISLLHRENFVELWFFTFAGSVQFFVGAYLFLHPERWKKLVPALIIIHGTMIVMWIITRFFPAPFLTFPEPFSVIGVTVAILEVLAVIQGIRILSRARVRRQFIGALLFGALVLGSLSYGMAKASENVIQSIPVRSEIHGHSLFSMFEPPHSDEAREAMEGMINNSASKGQSITEETMLAPDGHDNSDGHHDS